MRLSYWDYEGTCHTGVGRIAASMKRVHMVSHSPQGDDYINNMHTMIGRQPGWPPMSTSVIDRLTLGNGEVNLPKALEEAILHDAPDLALITRTCSASLLQEDLDALAHTAQIGDTRVVTYTPSPFRVQENQAADEVFTLLVKRFAVSQTPTPAPTVNILGPSAMGFHSRDDLISLRRMLVALGVGVNVVAPDGAGLDDLARLPAAWVTVAPYLELGTRAAESLEKQFGVPALTRPPIGLRATLAWLRDLIALLNERGAAFGVAARVTMPPLAAFSLDGLSQPTELPFFVRSADMQSFANKRVVIFGDATHALHVARFCATEIGMQVLLAGTYSEDWGDHFLREVAPHTEETLVTREFPLVAEAIDRLQPDLVLGTQMERHTARRHDIAATTISAPFHIEDNALGYHPFLGFDGVNTLADRIYHTAKLGLEKHLIEMFGDAGLRTYEQEGRSDATTVAPAFDAVVSTPQPPSRGGGERHSEVREPALAGVGASVGAGVGVNAAEQMNIAVPEVRREKAPEPAVSDGVVVWTDDAQALMGKIPKFVRGRVTRNTEKYARERGYTEITAAVLNEARAALS